MGDDRAMDDDRTVLPLPAAPESIELRHLRAFVAVAEELNFARAAARLYLSPPALSRQIRVLERLVGADLLRRSTHHVELTLAGEALLDRARGVLADVDEAVARTRAVGGELSGRMARLWAPTADAGLDVTALRRAGEALHGQFAPPPEVQVRAANAGGVPALRCCCRSTGLRPSIPSRPRSTTRSARIGGCWSRVGGRNTSRWRGIPPVPVWPCPCC